LSDDLTGATGTVDLSAISGAGVGIPALSGEGVSGVNSCPSIINISIGDVIIDPAPGFEITDTETMRDAVIATFKDIGFGELVVSNNSVS